MLVSVSGMRHRVRADVVSGWFMCLPCRLQLRASMCS
jgi:hypothetical protein